MELVVEPRAGRVDIVPRLVVRGVRGPVSLEVTTTDAAGHRWRSSGTYPVGEDGGLLPDDPERPWWDMAFADAGAVPVAFTAPDTELRYHVAVSDEGSDARADLVRSWGSGRPAEDVRGDGFALRVYRPAEVSGAVPSVVVVPGFTGMAAMAPTAALLASHGYTAGVLGYMQEPGLPSAFRQVPVEAVINGIREFTALPDVDPGRVGVVAVSVGTVAALGALSAGGAPPVGAVVAVAPTHVVWQALPEGGPPPKASMLTRDGRDLAYVPVRGEKLLGQILRTRVASVFSRRPRSAALRLLAAYQGGLAAHDAVSAAAIPVERIDAPMLAIAGEADAMWPSAEMAQALLNRHGQRGAGDRLLRLPDAGHFLRPPVTPTTVDRNESLISGGTPEGTARGQRVAWDAMLEFLAYTLR